MVKTKLCFAFDRKFAQLLNLTNCLNIQICCVETCAKNVRRTVVISMKDGVKGRLFSDFVLYLLFFTFDIMLFSPVV